MNQETIPEVKISSFEGGLEVFKLPRTWERDLEVHLSVVGGSRPFRVEAFPGEVDHLVLRDLDPDQPLDVRIQSSNLLRRLKRGTADFRIQPRAVPFRIVISGSGRCGTTTLAEYLDGMTFQDGEPVIAQHETLYEYILPWILDGDHDSIRRLVDGMPHNIESAPYFAHVPELISAPTVVHLVRDGRRVSQSGINRQWYETDTIWNLIKPGFEGTVFEKICHFWRHTNEQVEKISTVFVRLEDLSESEKARHDLLDVLGLESSGQVFPHSNKGKAPSGFASWTDEMRETFTGICGEMMDRYYPGWQDTW